jgi:hypothetical protein
LYDIDFPNAKHEQVDKLITEHKFPGSTIYKAPEGHLRAHLLDYGAENHENAKELARRAGSQSPRFHRGQIAFDGGDTREEAAEAYRRIARESGIQTRGAEGESRVGGHPSQGQHPLQSLYEEAEDNYARLAKEHGFGQPPEAAKPAEAAPPFETEEEAAPSTGPPALGEVPPAKGEKAKKEQLKEEQEKEIQKLAREQAAPYREDISPEEQAEMARLNKLGKTFAKKNPLLHPQSMHAHLTGQRKFPGKLKNEGIGEYYDANNPKLDYENEEHREHVFTRCRSRYHACIGRHVYRRQTQPRVRLV